MLSHLFHPNLSLSFPRPPFTFLHFVISSKHQIAQHLASVTTNKLSLLINIPFYLPFHSLSFPFFLLLLSLLPNAFPDALFSLLPLSPVSLTSPSPRLPLRLFWSCSVSNQDLSPLTFTRLLPGRICLTLPT